MEIYKGNTEFKGCETYYIFNKGMFAHSAINLGSYTILNSKDFWFPEMCNEKEFTWKDLQYGHIVVFSENGNTVPKFVHDIDGELYVQIKDKYVKTSEIKESFEDLGVVEIRRVTSSDHLYLIRYKDAELVYKVEKKNENENTEQKFRNMWNWLADNPTRSKEDYFLVHAIDGIPTNHCYACEYTKNKVGYRDCYYCPIGSEVIGCQNCRVRGLYAMWVKSCIEKDYEAASTLARAIANLKWIEK